MLRSTYEDGSTMSRSDIGDELLTLLAAGHETTASTLAWAFERISRHPDVLAALVAEADTQDNELRQATIHYRALFDELVTETETARVPAQ